MLFQNVGMKAGRIREFHIIRLSGQDSSVRIGNSLFKEKLKRDIATKSGETDYGEGKKDKDRLKNYG